MVPCKLRYCDIEHQFYFLISLHEVFRVSVRVFKVIYVEMDTFSLEEDDARDLFITQSSSQSQAESLIGVINAQKCEDNMSFPGGSHFGDGGAVEPHYSDISDDDAMDFQPSQANFE